MKIGYYAGTFWPFTNGHKHVVNEALKVFDKVIIGVHYNRDKVKVLFDEPCYYLEAIKSIFPKNRVEVIYETYRPVGVVAQDYKADCLIRGIRNATDYEYEENLAKINEELFNLSTVYFRAGRYGFISSSMVKELIKYKLDYKNYVPESIYMYLEEQ